MPPDVPPALGVSIRRLLLWSLNEQEQVETLMPVWQTLRGALPETDSTLLVTPSSSSLLWARSLNIPIVVLAEWATDRQTLSPDWHQEQSLKWIQTIAQNSFDAAIILTAPGQSPYAAAYLCYLAGIPIRIGQSHEFGGSILSHCITPPFEYRSLTDYYLHLLRSSLFPRSLMTV